ncbi:hypothetical protein [Streptomyces sulfonofaciens]|uniref:hypothetical protein n=1 Tax=Streptomyces sulfonofaciens TaxID=68272 RepID=UPI0016798B3A|nr:hypothetical protein [Streptomyces sulfonofaciens]
MHSGSGNQFVVTNWLIGANERLVRAGATRLRVVQEYRRRLAQCFVPPRHYGKAAERLNNPGAVVLLNGPSGSGRRAAATMLLEGAAAPGSRIEELPLRWEEDSLDASVGDCYLLDLSGVSDSEYPEAQRSLMHYGAITEQSGARLVAVLPAGQEWMLDRALSPLVVQLERPRGRAVFARCLRVNRVPFEPEQLDTEVLARMFSTSPMRELARLADLVVRARDSHQYGNGFEAWCVGAVAAVTDASDAVVRQLRDHRGGLDRALLLTAAMTSGAAAEAVLSGALRLLEVLRHERDDTPRLAQTGLGEQLRALAISRDGDGWVSFAQLDYDSAVRRHFWQNFPDLRPAFRDWVGRCMELSELRGEDRMRLVARFAEQALATGRPDDLCVLARRWTHPDAGGKLRPEAAAVLELGLSHDQYGSHLRSRVYGWVTAGPLPEDLARVLTDVCQQVMAATHPEQAVVRLRHLAVRQAGAEAAAARAAVLTLARGNRFLFRRLAMRLVNAGLSSPRNADILLDLLDPTDLRIQPPWREFTLGWRVVMNAMAAEVWTPVVQRWLSALEQRRGGNRVLHALLLAAAGDDLLLNRLYVATRAWAGQSPPGPPQVSPTRCRFREEIAERFCREIDLVQGVDEAGPGPDPQCTTESI